MSAEEMEHKTKSLLEEFLHLNDLKEACACVEELPVSSRQLFVSAALMQSLERSPAARLSTACLLAHLVHRAHALTHAQFIEGLQTILDLAHELVIDVSRFWACLASLVAPAVVPGGGAEEEGRVKGMGLAELRPAWGAVGRQDVGRWLAMVLRDVETRVGRDAATGAWTESGLEWSEFIEPDRLSAFLTDNEVQFTVQSAEAGAPTGKAAKPSPALDARISTTLDDMVRADKSNEEITSWIEKSVDPAVSGGSPFVRALVTAVCSHCIQNKSESDTYLVDAERLKLRTSLLKSFISSSELELDALYALQALLHSLAHPSGVLYSLFNTLYDEDIIAEETYYTWSKSADPSSQIGRGVALKSVAQFFDWLASESADS